MFWKRKIPAKIWNEKLDKKKLKERFPSSFLFRRKTCGICGCGIKLQFAWEYEWSAEGGYGYTKKVVSYICKVCAPTREQLAFLSINLPDMPKYEIIIDAL